MAAAWAAFGATATLITLASNRLARKHRQTSQTSANQTPERHTDHQGGNPTEP
jgi:hypothetical protein